MKIGVYFWALLLAVVVQSCKSPAGVAREQEKLKRTEQSLEKQDFKVIFNRALPKSSSSFNRVFNQLHRAGYSGSTAGSIDLTSNYAYLSIKNDSISGELPFFGERYMGGGYNRDESIKFDGPAKSILVETNPKYTEIQFEAIHQEIQNDLYRGSMRIYPNGKVDLNLNSAHRSPIGYLGEIVFEE